ncbi:transposase [Bacillus sp. FJAT-50079]|nr:transposase [Bacillus sp. FJAT-50079]
MSDKGISEVRRIPGSKYYHLVKQINRLHPNANLKDIIKANYDEHKGRYGYRRIRDELTYRGQKVKHKKGSTYHERTWFKMFSTHEKI